MYVNSFQCCGNIASDISLKDHQGSPYCKFAIALNKPGKEGPIYIDCIAWADKASLLVEYCQRGQEIHLSGEIETRTYTDRQGVNRKGWTLKVEKMSMGRTPQRRREELEVRVPKVQI